MFTNLNTLQEFPYKGTFYRQSETRTTDGELINIPEPDEEIILNVSCDIQQTSKLFNSGAMQNQWAVYFYFDLDTGLPGNFRRGMRFRSNIHGLPIDGTVIGIDPKELAPSAAARQGSCRVEIKGSDD